VVNLLPSVRRTSTTTWSGLPSLVVVIVRINFLAEVEFTTPSLKNSKTEVMRVGFIGNLQSSLTENWDSQFYEFGEED